MTPYHYSANNPLIAKDPEGTAITWIKSSDKYDEKWGQDMYNDAIAYLEENNVNTVEILKDIRDNPNYNVNVKVEPTSKYSYYDPVENTLHWSPYYASETENAMKSPTEILVHEGDHAQRANKDDKEEFKRDSKFPSKNMPHTDREEARVIRGSEYETARALGHLKDINKPYTRTTHDDGRLYKVSGPRSIIPVNDKYKEH